MKRGGEALVFAFQPSRNNSQTLYVLYSRYTLYLSLSCTNPRAKALRSFLTMKIYEMPRLRLYVLNKSLSGSRHVRSPHVFSQRARGTQKRS